jgi:hypothetical protein
MPDARALPQIIRRDQYAVCGKSKQVCEEFRYNTHAEIVGELVASLLMISYLVEVYRLR